MDSVPLGTRAFRATKGHGLKLIERAHVQTLVRDVHDVPTIRRQCNHMTTRGWKTVPPSATESGTVRATGRTRA